MGCDVHVLEKLDELQGMKRRGHTAIHKNIYTTGSSLHGSLRSSPSVHEHSRRQGYTARLRGAWAPRDLIDVSGHRVEEPEEVMGSDGEYVVVAGCLGVDRGGGQGEALVNGDIGLQGGGWGQTVAAGRQDLHVLNEDYKEQR